jgi:hypothetical protein
VSAVAESSVASAAALAADVAHLDFNQLVREGHYEAPLVQEQVCCCSSIAAAAYTILSDMQMWAWLRLYLLRSSDPYVWCTLFTQHVNYCI